MNNNPVQGADAELQAGTIALSKQAYAVAIVFSAFQVVTAAYSPLSSTVVRAIHVGFLLLMTFVVLPPLGRKWLGWAVGTVAFAIGLYHWVFEAELIQRAGDLTNWDMGPGPESQRVGRWAHADRGGTRSLAIDGPCAGRETPRPKTPHDA